MRKVIEFLFRVALPAPILLIWWWALITPLSNVMNLSIIVGGELLVFPVIWLGRKVLTKSQPLPAEIGLILVIVTGAATLLTMINL